MVQSVFLNWRRAPWTACFLAIITIVHPTQSQQSKPAESNVAAANRAVQSQLPLSDRQDLENVMRGFYRDNPRPEQARPIRISRARGAADRKSKSLASGQLNVPNGLFKVVDGVYQVRGFSVASMTIVEGKIGVIVIDTLATPGAALGAL
jgi:alkyl sulfatase BDS1-like metallo-beta-lactamase superfamily hydrolase